jgi:hypothetical protein
VDAAIVVGQVAVIVRLPPQKAGGAPWQWLSPDRIPRIGHRSRRTKNL